MRTHKVTLGFDINVPDNVGPGEVEVLFKIRIMHLIEQELHGSIYQISKGKPGTRYNSWIPGTRVTVEEQPK